MDTTHFLYTLIFGMTPSLLWLWFWLREDHLHPEPRGLLAGAFMIGMIGVIVAMIVQPLVLPYVHTLQQQYISWAAIEEIIKFAGAYIITFHSIDMDEPIDALIYIITVALGFAALENTFNAFNHFSHGDITNGILNSNMRFIGATILHSVASACVGLALGLTFYFPKKIRVVAGFAGLLGAIALHSFFNLSIISASNSEILKTFGWIWFAAIVLLIFFEEVKTVRPRGVSGMSRTL